MKNWLWQSLLWLAAASPAVAFDQDHLAWGRILKAHVHDGEVDYQALRRDRTPLTAYLTTLEAVTADDFARFSRDERLAFWINAYNAYTVQLIVDHWPVASIKKIGGLFRSPFALAFIPLTKLRGKSISLNTIEHEILRAEFHEPRIHTAIVCASKSCPELRNEAYRGSGLDGQLESAMRGFLADPRRNRWLPARQTLELSSIFKWFRDDFETQGTLTGYIGAHLEPEAAKSLAATKAPRIVFLDYDWSLNGH